MRLDLRAMAMRANPGRRKRAVTIRDIAPPAIFATDLYQAGYKPVLALIDRYAALAQAEYERTLSALITDSADDLTSIFERMGQELSALVLMLRPSLRDWTVRVERYQRRKWRGAVLAASKVDIDTIIGPDDVAQTLGDILNWNVALVKDVGEQARGKISTAVFAGLRTRSPARDVTKQIQEATGFARDRSLRIASHQLSTLSSSLASERRRQAGLTVYRYRHSAKLHPRLDHLARNNKLYGETEADAGQIVEGETVNAPIPANDRAGVKPGCGCREQGVLIFT